MLALFFLWNCAVHLQPAATPLFEMKTIDTTVSIGYGIALADVDGDGKKDILLADKKQFVWYRNGDWKRFVMVENLTQRDNVCIAARDLDGDGKAEVAVGAQWNPGETSDTTQSGSVHYLVRPADPTKTWQEIPLHHEPTTHRMQWVKMQDGYHLVVVPLHGRGNKNGEGRGVKIMAYAFPKTPGQEWKMRVLDSSMHLTHNLFVNPNPRTGFEDIFIAGKEGVKQIGITGATTPVPIAGMEQPAGELKISTQKGTSLFATIEPMHGNTLAVYSTGETTQRQVLDDQLKEGHALAMADFLNNGSLQIAAGWRLPSQANKTGIKLYVAEGNNWTSHWIDDNGMATEDLQVADLNADGKPDIVAAGRATKNLKIYWNKN